MIGLVDGGLRSHAGEVKKAGEKFNQFNAEEKKQQQNTLLGESRAKVELSLNTELGNLRRRLDTCRSLLVDKVTPKFADSVHALMDQLKSQEVRSDLVAMSEAEKIALLDRSCQSGDCSILRSIESQPATQKLVDPAMAGRFREVYNKVAAPQETANSELMTDVVEAAERIAGHTMGECKMMEGQV